MSKTVLLTRPIDASLRLAEELTGMGFEPLIVPLISVQKVEGVMPDISKYDVVLVTSAHAVQVMAQETDMRDVAIWTVGDHTAAEARRLGFDDVRSVSGTASLLAAQAEKEPHKRYLYLSGKHKAFMLKAQLTQKGITCDEYILYEAIIEPRMPMRLLQALEKKAIDYALFYSRRTAEGFMNLVEREGCTSALASIQALCFSDSVLKSIKPELWSCTHVCAHPDHDHMIALLSDVSANETVRGQKA
jgi:uroporphyrinogen-III synthase